ncbi:hypothetical protein Fmac_026815 [Flemingia macrophylla]|uniref:Uncharacterized protein n=1 Tax=Flemingia macrophylla TaxID=520843 RepID=A0ABD1LFY9_9FABA
MEIQREWNMHELIPFLTFSKLSFAVPDHDDLLFCGAVECYDRDDLLEEEYQDEGEGTL